MTPSSTTRAKITYIPYMGDYSYVIQAGYQANDMPAEVLPPPDHETLTIGLAMCKGRECLPCFTIAGDILRRAAQPDFTPDQAVVLIPSNAMVIPCLFGQYGVLHQAILNEQGLRGVEIISPSSKNGFSGMGDHPNRLRLLLLQGIIALDLLTRLLHEYRPYETRPGQADACYHQGLEHILTAIRQGGNTALVAAMHEVAAQFATLPCERTPRRPMIGIVGDIYVRLNHTINCDIIRVIESLGGEVYLSSAMEWVNYSTWEFLHHAQQMGNYRQIFQEFATDKYQRYQQRKLAHPVRHLLRKPYEPPIGRVLDHVRPYYDPSLGSECVVSLGAAIEYARHGCSGILHVFPFACMPGLITTSLVNRIREDLNLIPWLDIAYDGQATTNIHTRLEAFFYQAEHYHRQVLQHTQDQDAKAQ